MNKLPIKLNLEIIEILADNEYVDSDISKILSSDISDVLAKIPKLQNQNGLVEHLEVLKTNELLRDTISKSQKVLEFEENIFNQKISTLKIFQEKISEYLASQDVNLKINDDQNLLEMQMISYAIHQSKKELNLVDSILQQDFNLQFQEWKSTIDSFIDLHKSFDKIISQNFKTSELLTSKNFEIGLNLILDKNDYDNLELSLLVNESLIVTRDEAKQFFRDKMTEEIEKHSQFTKISKIIESAKILSAPEIGDSQYFKIGLDRFSNLTLNLATVSDLERLESLKMDFIKFSLSPEVIMKNFEYKQFSDEEELANWIETSIEWNPPIEWTNYTEEEFNDAISFLRDKLILELRNNGSLYENDGNIFLLQHSTSSRIDLTTDPSKELSVSDQLDELKKIINSSTPMLPTPKKDLAKSKTYGDPLKELLEKVTPALTNWVEITGGKNDFELLDENFADVITSEILDSLDQHKLYSSIFEYDYKQLVGAMGEKTFNTDLFVELSGFLENEIYKIRNNDEVSLASNISVEITKELFDVFVDNVVFQLNDFEQTFLLNHNSVESAPPLTAKTVMGSVNPPPISPAMEM